MTLKDILKKKDKVGDNVSPPPAGLQPPPEFKFIRSDTHTEETIQPPAFGDTLAATSNEESNEHKHSGFGDRLRRFSNASSHGPPSNESSPKREKGERRLSQRFNFRRKSRSGSTSSVNLPNLPSIGNGDGDAQDMEAQWEKRATVLAQGTTINARPSTPLAAAQQRSRSPSVGRINDAESDVCLVLYIQMARYHSGSILLTQRRAPPLSKYIC